MSRANIDDKVFIVSFAGRGLAIGLMVVGIIRLIQSMWDEIEYELGGLPNFQAKP